MARLEGERGRTMNQLRLFAKVVRDGVYLNATLDSALPERVPPRPDLRLRKLVLAPSPCLVPVIFRLLSRLLVAIPHPHWLRLPNCRQSAQRTFRHLELVARGAKRGGEMRHASRCVFLFDR